MYEYTINLSGLWKYSNSSLTTTIIITHSTELGGTKEVIFKLLYNIIGNDLLITNEDTLIVLSDLYNFVINTLTVKRLK